MKKINFKEIVKLVEKDEEEFLIEIIQFKLRRGYKGKQYYIDRKTGKNIIDKFELWDYC